MKTGKWVFIQAALLMLLIPAVLRPFFLKGQGEKPRAEEPPKPHTVLVRHGGTNVEMELEAYLVGVVLAEMPAEFEPEALRAQAVVARTFAWKAAVTGGKHGDGSVCVDPGCCQGFLAPGHYLQTCGTESGLEKIRTAVHLSEGLVLTYDGELIEATYFSSTAGSTEDAAAVWGCSYPYLVSRESPEEVPVESTAFSRAWLEHTLGTRLEENSDEWFTQWEYTAGGGVASVNVGERTFSGTLLRQKLKLRSTVFSVTVQNDAAVFVTRGCGHRVGMSQFGADAMAASGSSFADILAYYYPGTEMTQIRDEKDILGFLARTN